MIFVFLFLNSLYMTACRSIYISADDSFVLFMAEFIPLYIGFPGGSDGKVSAHSAGDLGSIPGSG